MRCRNDKRKFIGERMTTSTESESVVLVYTTVGYFVCVAGRAEYFPPNKGDEAYRACVRTCNDSRRFVVVQA